MGIYDSIVLHDSVEISGFPFNASHQELRGGDRRMWQTKDLNPSMDTYAILPAMKHFGGETEFADSQELYLYRRHPPITKWTTENRGVVGGEYPDDIIEEAEHWRNIRYTGTISITDLAEDSKTYTVEIDIENGVVRGIQLESEYTAVDGVFPPRYMEVIDVSDNNPTYNGQDISEIAQDFYGGEDLDIPSSDLGKVLTFYQTRTIDGQFPDFDSLFEFDENDNPKYKGKTPKEWSNIINDGDHQLDEEEVEIIRIYRALQRDLQYQNSEKDV